MYDNAALTSEETLENIKTVASLNCQNSRIHQYAENLKPLKNSCIKAGIFDGIGWGLIYSIMFAVIGIMFYIATLYIIEERETWVQGTLDISDVIMVYYCSFMGSSLIGISSTSLKKILRGAASANKIMELSRTPEIASKNLRLYEIPWEIQYKNVEFIYPSKPSVKVLRDIYFNISPGEKIGLVGITGCGKSSIAQLLLGFYNCTSGSIEVNGSNIQDLDIKFLRERISYVNQEPLLYSTTIKKNIKLGRLECTDDEIVEAAKCAEAFDFIEDMPKKMKSYVGIKGSQLSGGEKQRIALARCFIRKPKILIMDEATSALDAITEEKILENITNRFPDTSMLVIAQKLKTLRNTDVIYVIEDGKIIERGSFDILISTKSYFYKLSESDKQSNNSREIPEVVESNEIFEENYETESKNVGGNVEKSKNQSIKVSLLPISYISTIITIVISSIISGISFPLYGYLFSQILINLFGMENSAKEENFHIMWYMIAISIILFISLIVLNYSLSIFMSTYTEKLRNDSFSSLVYYDSTFFDKRKNNPRLNYSAPSHLLRC